MFSTQLRKYRLAAGLSQKELAGKLFVSQQAVARWETDKATPNPETVVKLAKIFGVTTDELLGKELVLGGEGNAKQNFRENLQAAFWGGEKDLTQEDLDALADSIALSGLQQPLVVTPSPDKPGKFTLISGHRRRLL